MQQQLTVQFLLVLVVRSSLAAIGYIQKWDSGQCIAPKQPSQWYPRPVSIHVGHPCYPFVPDDGTSDRIAFPDQTDMCCSCQSDRQNKTLRPSDHPWSEPPIGSEMTELPFPPSLIVTEQPPSGGVEGPSFERPEGTKPNFEGSTEFPSQAENPNVPSGGTGNVPGEQVPFGESSTQPSVPGMPSKPLNTSLPSGPEGRPKPTPLPHLETKPGAAPSLERTTVPSELTTDVGPGSPGEGGMGTTGNPDEGKEGSTENPTATTEDIKDKIDQLIKDIEHHKCEDEQH